MTNTTSTPTDRIVPIRRDTDAEQVGRAVYEDLLRVLVTLEPEDWHLPTECPGWTVADMVRHLLGAAKAHASLREEARQFRHARRHAKDHDGSSLDAMNDLQVREHTHLSGPELVSELDAVWSAALHARLGRPAVLRALRIPNDTSGSTPPGTGRRIRLGHLFDTILTRDVWMHRVDICRAVGRTPTFADHDRRVVEDVIAEWAARVRAGIDLTIPTPYSARYVAGDGKVALEIDGIELCRVLSGRAHHPSPLFETKVLF